MNILSHVANWVASGLLALGLLSAPSVAPVITELPQPEPVEYTEPSYAENQALGAVVPQSPALYDGFLAQGITANQTSMTLSSGVLRNNQALSGYFCFTIDANTPQIEYVCGNASGTSVTNLMRGVDVINPNATSSALAFSHRRFASVAISDYPTLQILVRKINGEDNLSDTLSYDNGVTPVSGGDLVDVEYVLSAISGTSSLSFDKQVVPGTAGVVLATGTVVYLNPSDARWYGANAATSSTYTDVTVGITQGAGTVASAITGGVLLSGYDQTKTGLSAGRNYFIATTTGALTLSTTSKYIGQARSATQLYVQPGLVDSQIFRLNENNVVTGTTTFSGFVVGATKIDIYTANATWTKPTVSRSVQVFLIGGGGGGGGGGYGTSNPWGSGGGGGGGGGLSSYTFPTSILGATETITVGTGGTGGAGRAGSSGSGIAGTAGGNSSFGSWITATGGSGGTAGVNGTPLAGGPGGIGNIANGTNGGDQGSSLGNGGNSSSTTNFQPTGGGGGGGANTGDGGLSGGRSGVATLAGAVNDAPGNSVTAGQAVGGTGGGGGTSTGLGGTALPGQNGGLYGGGGGGGAGSGGTNTAGSGGNGANGIVVVITY